MPPCYLLVVLPAYALAAFWQQLRYRTLVHDDSRRSLALGRLRKVTGPPLVVHFAFAGLCTVIGLGDLLRTGSMLVGLRHVGANLLVVASFLVIMVWIIWSGVKLRKLMKHVELERLQVCPNCHYSLIGHSAGGACPECGYKFSSDSLLQDWMDIATLSGWSRRPSWTDVLAARHEADPSG